MEIDVTLKNYRCFQDCHPACIRLQPGFISLLGANNAGKSSLLKFFYELRSLFQVAADQHVFERALTGQPQVFNFAPGHTDNEELFCNANDRDMRVVISIRRNHDDAREHPRPAELAFTVPRGTNTWRAELFSKRVKIPLAGQCVIVNQNGRLLLRNDGQLKADLSDYFAALPLLARTLYIGPFRNAINVGTKQDYFDIQVGQAFIKRWRALKSGGQRKDNEATYRLTEDIRRIFEFDKLEINPTPDDQNLQLFINGKSYLLTEQGAGLAQFILVLANAAVRRPTYVLIDEPELNLHPSLQLDFLTTLGSYTSEGGVIFATHSYGLARAVGDLVYAVRRSKSGAHDVAPLESTYRLTEFLGELSYSGYAALGFNKVLLVEGPSEVKTLQQFLRQLGKDHKVVLLQLGGSSLIKEDCGTELQEVRRICDDVHALIDSERSAARVPLERGRAAFQQACQDLGIRCCVLERRATENYLTDAAVKKVKGEKYRALAPYEAREAAPLSWGKAENWRIAREMSFSDIGDTDLGKFLESL